MTNDTETTLFEKFKETGQHGIVFGLGTILQSAIGFLLIPLYTTHLTTSDYGILGLILITGNILSAIFALGLGSGLFRSYYDYDDEENRREVISTALFLIAISCVILSVCGLLFSSYLSILLFGNTNYKIHLLMIFIISFLGILNSIPFIIFRARKKSIQYAVLQISFVILGICTIVYFVAIKNWGVFGVLLGQVITGTISLFTLYSCIRKDIVLKFSGLEARKMLHFGVPLVPADLTSLIMNYFDRYMLDYYCTLSMVGLYHLGYQFGMVIMTILVMPLRLIWGPMFLSVKDHSNAKDFYSMALTYVIAIGAFLFLGLALLSKEVIYIVANKEYWGAYTVVPLITLTYLFYSVEIILNVGIGLERKTKVVALYFFIGAIANIILNFALIPEYGMIGAAYATLISFIIMITIVYFYNQKLIKIDYEWDRILKICLVTALIFTVGYGVIINDLYGSIAFKIGIILLYPLILYLLRFYSSDEIKRIKQIFGYVLVKLKVKKSVF